MPKVGKKAFPYTAKGKKSAQRYAKTTGQKVQKAKKASKRGY
ncbi:uncharacterized protein METZ01_LOCUS371047 [marine metagenome]|uniref:Uncharacterized protein n=1 Tax=marine metagenome TaxID=408172 RepID=A0A382T854_9ZZZZ